MSRVKLLTVLTVSLAVSAPALAQQGLPDLRNRVVDHQGSVLPGLTIVVRHQEFGHPTAHAMSRLRAVGTQADWISVASGVSSQSPLGFVRGDIGVEVPPPNPDFTAGQRPALPPGAPPAPAPPPGAPPGPPQNFTGVVSGNTVTLSWRPPTTGAVPTSYLLEAALSPGGAIIAALPINSTAIVIPGVPNGTYYLKMRAVNANGQSNPSNEIVVAVPGGGGGCASPPHPPQNLNGSVSGSLISVNWRHPAGGCSATSFALHAGSAPGSSNIAVANVGPLTALSGSAPSGTYYIRVIVLNAYGGSAPSNEIALTVGSRPAPPPGGRRR